MLKRATKTIQKQGKCAACRQPTSNRVGLKWVCNMDCVIAFTQAAKAKKALNDRKIERKETREAKQNIKTLGQMCSEARTVVQKYARVRDAKFKTCICCGEGPIEHGGHRFAVGSKYRCARLSLDDRQIHGCCIRCNVFVGGGNTSGFDAGLLRRYGQPYIDSLLELKRKADSGDDAPLTKSEVLEIKSKYARLTRELLNRAV